MSFVGTRSEDRVLTLVNDLTKERKFLTVLGSDSWNVLIINSPRAHDFFLQLLFLIFVVNGIMTWAWLLLKMILMLFVIKPRGRRVKRSRSSGSRVHTVSFKSTC